MKPSSKSRTAAFRNTPTDMSLEWEALPSLAHLIEPAASSAERSEHVWLETQPAAFQPLMPSDAFLELLPGMDMREVLEPDVFTHFFGPASTPATGPAARPAVVERGFHVSPRKGVDE